MEKQKSFLEVLNTEKQMLALIYSKGIIHNDVLELYHKIRAGCEKMLLDSNQMVEHQEVEYHLWKLHYELIDEFRKRSRPRSYDEEKIKNDKMPGNINSQGNIDKGLEGFKSFLSEATEFYRKLIIKLRESRGLHAEVFIKNKDRRSFSIEQTKLHECQHTCHRLLICLGDLARYSEIVKKPDACEWSAAATYYLEATRTWPDSGNPHNQLALLATYVGDAFLALYHCVRSLAVKEPFPDAWRNIMLLFEENRSTKLPSFSSQRQIDFLNPSKRSYLQQEEKGSPHTSKLADFENVCSEKFQLWPILVRTICFLLIRSSLEEFPGTLTSALHSLETLLEVDDTKLTVTLESYRQMDSSRRGPYRAIQLVSIFIFIVHSLTESLEREESSEKDNQKHSALTPLAFAAIFICMGRLTERCLRESCKDVCPLLPSVLVFSEWLVGALHTIETYDADDRVKNALSYFIGALADLLDRIDQNGKRAAPDYTALWEDHELRGFCPLTRVHEMLDFATQIDCVDNYKSRNECRFQRIVHAATRIMVLSRSFQQRISCDHKVGRLFDSVETTKFQDKGSSVSNHEVKEPDEQMDRSLKDKEKSLPEEIACPKTQATTEEEEVILFKPITRRNSAPLYISKPINDAVCPDETQIRTEPADEWLRRATSLLNGQNVEDTDSFSFCSTTSNSGQNKSLKENEPQPAGPPSLSGWVLSKGSSNIESGKGMHDFSRQKLSPIEETASTSFFDLSINETKDSHAVATGHISTIVHDSSPRVPPLPSAPLLPDDAAWLTGNSLVSSNEADGILGAAPISGYTGRSAVHPPISFVSGLVDGYPPLLGMSSSEWLYHYRNSQNMAANISPVHLHAPAFGNYHSNELSSFDLCDQWGNRWVSNPMHYFGSSLQQVYPNSGFGYGAEDQKRDKFYVGYQRPYPYVCGVGMEMSPEEPSLLQYLKEKERQLQPASQLRNPTYMGN